MVRESFLYLLLLLLVNVQSSLTGLQDRPLDLQDLDSFQDDEWSLLQPWLIPPGYALQRLCPNTDICSSKLRYDVSKDGPACCIECSCESDCGLTNNCCYEELDNYRETNSLETETSACLFPVTQLPVKEKRQAIQSYFMVDQCPDELACDTCGHTKVAEWGSLYPVYSRRTGKIYKNERCADCYNVTDGQLWDPYLVVDLDARESKAVNAGHILISKLTNTHNTIVRFAAPNASAIKPQACFKNLIDFCMHDGAYHMYGNLTDHELCESGLRAPMFYEGDYYANAFCVYCRLNRFNPRNAPCSPRIDIAPGHLVVMLDKALSALHKFSPKRKACSPVDKTCKDVHCPAGHVLNDGQCVLVHTKWLHKNVHVMLEFSPVSSSDLVNRYDKDGLDISIPLPGDISWKLMSTVVEMGPGNHIVRLYADFVWSVDSSGQVMPTDIITEAEGLVKRTECYFRQEGKVYTYQANISRYAYLERHIKKNKTAVQPLWFGVRKANGNGNEQGTENEMVDMLIVAQNNIDIDLTGIPISINKLFFCQQVEIGFKEFASFYNGTQIFYKTGKYFFDGEFALTEREDGSKVARICLEDSGYVLVSGEAFRFRASIPLLVMVGVITYLVGC